MLLPDLLTLELLRLGVRTFRRLFTRLIRSVFRVALLAVVVLIGIFLVQHWHHLQPTWLRAKQLLTPEGSVSSPRQQEQQHDGH